MKLSFDFHVKKKSPGLSRDFFTHCSDIKADGNQTISRIQPST